MEVPVRIEVAAARSARSFRTASARISRHRAPVNSIRSRTRYRGLAGLRDARPGPVGPRTCTPAVVDFLRARAPTTRRCRSRVAGPPRAHARSPSTSADGGADRGRWSTKKTLRGGEPVAGAAPDLAAWRFSVAGGPGPRRIRAAAGCFPGLGQPRSNGAAGRARPRGLGRAPHTPGDRVNGALCGRAFRRAGPGRWMRG